jgi:hypothetical protein
VHTTVDIEEIESTKSEKLLAVVLAAFLLVGGIWAYAEIADRIPVRSVAATPAEAAALERAESAGAELFAARQREEQALRDLELARETYRTALDAGRPAAALERGYRGAQRAYDAAVAERGAVEAEQEAARPAAEGAGNRLAQESAEASRGQALFAFLARLGLAAAALTGALVLLSRLRRRGSRYLPVDLAAVGAATLLSLVLAGDYVTDYVDPQELGPLVLSAFGVAATLAAFVALQRYLARSVPFRRVRKRQCPYCGFPAGDGRCCEGCGRELVATCAGCTAERRVGAAHCGACGVRVIVSGR